MEERLKTMMDLAKAAGDVQRQRLPYKHDVEYKGVINLVTEVDKACETLIVNGIGEKFPEDDILAEEGSDKKSGSDIKWIVDPLDGTVNYAHGFPFFCVSLAIEKAGRLHTGVIYDPNRDEMFYAQRKMGAFMDDKPIHVTDQDDLRKSMLATGFAYNVQEGEAMDNLDNFSRFIKTARAVRRPGSAAIDLAWVACGRLDGFWELFLKPWDMAAGVVIIEEAGGRVTSFDRSDYDLYGTQILASNGRIHDRMSEVLGEG